MPTVDEQISFLHDNIQYLYNKYILIKTKKCCPNEKPWFSNEIKILISERNKAYERWKKFRTPELKQVFRSRRSDVNYRIRAAKRKFYEDKFTFALSSQKKWREIRDMGVLNKDKSTNCDVNVDQLNLQFSNIPSISSNINYYFTDTNVNSSQESSGFQFSNVTVDQVYKSLQNIKSNSVGYDEIHPKFMKVIIDFIIIYITHLFNTILTTSNFPSMWKHAKIIPIPKSDKTYRPIAILPYLSKAFERIVHDQISKYLHDNYLLTNRQSGFRSMHSCVTALVDVAEELRLNVDKNMVSFLVLLDHSKAFDTVDHHILSYKLKNIFNFSTSAQRLLQTYLRDRSQSVHHGNKRSASCPVKRGVPQGSILGPLLYIMYSNDLPACITHCGIQMYADDVQLYISCPKTDINDCVDKLNKDLDNIYKWATANGLCLNANKSKAIVIGNNNFLPSSLPSLAIGDSPIEFVQNAKNLGIVFNGQLTWNNHINVICGKTYAMLRNLWRTQFFTPINVRMLLAKTYIIPTLLYGCEIFAGLDSISKCKLNVTYNNIARYIFGRGRYSSISYYTKQIYNMPIDGVLNCRLLIFLHKIIYNGQPSYLYNRLQFSRSNRGYKINNIRYQKQVSERHFYINAIRLWNQLPSDIQTIRNAMQFKNAIRTHFSHE